MTVFSPNFSARTTNPEGRKGRNPTVVRMTRSAATFTRARRGIGRGAAGASARGGRAVEHPAAAARGKDASRRRRVTSIVDYIDDSGYAPVRRRASVIRRFLDVIDDEKFDRSLAGF